MTKKIHPSTSSNNTQNHSATACATHHHPLPPPSPSPTTLTVWRKSLLFNCSGFTVFDSNGNLIYRVDNYSRSGTLGQILLMDAAGKPCLTIRRKMKLFVAEQWGIYDGESAVNPWFLVRKKRGLLRSNGLARVLRRCGCEGYEVEGDYRKRRCVVVDEKRREMVEMKMKEAVFGLDVFRLVVQPGFDSAVAMAIVLLLEEMIGSKN